MLNCRRSYIDVEVQRVGRDLVGNRLRKIKRHGKNVGLSVPERPAPAGHQYIIIGKYHRNLSNAESYAADLFRQADDQLTAQNLMGTVLRLNLGEKDFVLKYDEAVRTARARGTVENLRSLLNGSDPYFVFTMSMAASGEGPSFQLGFAGQKLKLEAPMRQGSIEAELTDDILEHRRIASRSSAKDSDGFKNTSMHFRSYILSCCALVEAFLNRCVLIDTSELRTSPELVELQKPCAMERKFELWLRQYANQPLSAINGGVEWDHFSELRRLRNSLMHATTSMLGIGLKDTARQLNLVRHGVGGLLLKLRALQQLPPIPFAESLRTAPECRFQSEA